MRLALVRPDMRPPQRPAEKDNFYRTPPAVTKALLDVEDFTDTVWDPCCGDGLMAYRPGGVLALDLSLHTGWAYAHGFDGPISGVWNLGRVAELGRALSGLAGEVEAAITLYEPATIIFEAPLTMGGQTSNANLRLLVGAAGVVEMIAYEAGIKCLEEAVDTVRKAVIGFCRQKKTDPKGWVKQCVFNWAVAEGFKPADNNESDALALLRYMLTMQRAKVMAGAGSVAF